MRIQHLSASIFAHISIAVWAIGAAIPAFANQSGFQSSNPLRSELNSFPGDYVNGTVHPVDKPGELSSGEMTSESAGRNLMGVPEQAETLMPPVSHIPLDQHASRLPPNRQSEPQFSQPPTPPQGDRVASETVRHFRTDMLIESHISRQPIAVDDSHDKLSVDVDIVRDENVQPASFRAGPIARPDKLPSGTGGTTPFAGPASLMPDNSIRQMAMATAVALFGCALFVLGAKFFQQKKTAPAGKTTAGVSHAEVEQLIRLGKTSVLRIVRVGDQRIVVASDGDGIKSVIAVQPQFDSLIGNHSPEVTDDEVLAMTKRFSGNPIQQGEPVEFSREKLGELPVELRALLQEQMREAEREKMRRRAG